MQAKVFFFMLVVYLQYESAFGQRQWVSPTTTAQEMRNPSTWYRPYYQAAAEAYAKYFQNAQEIRNQLWQQAYTTGAFGSGGSGGGSGGSGGGSGGSGGGSGGSGGGSGGVPVSQNWG